MTVHEVGSAVILHQPWLPIGWNWSQPDTIPYPYRTHSTTIWVCNCETNIPAASCATIPSNASAMQALHRSDARFEVDEVPFLQHAFESPSNSICSSHKRSLKVCISEAPKLCLLRLPWMERVQLQRGCKVKSPHRLSTMGSKDGRLIGRNLSRGTDLSRKDKLPASLERHA